MLCAMFNLLNESTARREIFQTVTGSSKFSKQFCGIRWVEDEDVAVRGIEVWPDFVKLVKHYESQCKSKRPDNKSYATLVDQHDNSFVPLRMQFFRDIARLLHKFLVQFQTDSPMIPFLSNELEKQLTSLMKIIVKRAVLISASTPYTLLKVDVEKEANRVNVDSIEIGTTLKEMLHSL